MATQPTDGVETFYPIQPVVRSNVLVYQQDDGQIDEVQKSGSTWRHEIVTLKFRIMDAYIEAFIEFLEANVGVTMTLNTPGISPFLRTATSNTVYIIPPWSTPKKSGNLPLHWEMSVTYRNVETTPP